MKIHLTTLEPCIAFTIVLLLEFAKESAGVNVAEDLSLSSKERYLLDVFRKNVQSKLTKEYQNSDIYLIRWLRAKQFDVNAAGEMLLQDIKWRKDQRMDTIFDEDWNEFEKDYPYQVDGYDNDDKPIMTANFEEWDLRKGMLTGKRDPINRWMAGIFEKSTTRVRELQTEGKNVTRWNFIINMNNFNLVQHACIPCLQFYIALVTNFENHFPNSADKIMLINTPTIFEIVLNLIRPVMSPETREALKVYGKNKKEWEPILFKDIDRNQLPKTYGGTKANY